MKTEEDLILPAWSPSTEQGYIHPNTSLFRFPYFNVSFTRCAFKQKTKHRFIEFIRNFELTYREIVDTLRLACKKENQDAQFFGAKRTKGIKTDSTSFEAASKKEV
ncbi:hypothetical protein AVEN_68412-1 [Araneus ventricosus]|uniref:Uncharacterized protein n=1 Tax=Araneus ventricosus TaxID=182803 RepID=A0A4Y2UZL8_ARAVE|nr:hypothetical protein AVEN_68412-1 [Araneus ventricosus]